MLPALSIPLAATACGSHATLRQGGERMSLVVTQTPAGRAGGPGEDWRPPDARYPDGSRVVLVDPDRPDAEPRVLSAGLAGAGAPDLSPDAGSVLFAGKRTADDSWSVFESRVRGSGARPVMRPGRDCVDPAYLPGHRWVAACADPPGGTDDRTWSLYTGDLDGGPLERITFGPDSAQDPTPLADGRILFAMRSTRSGDGDRARAAPASLFTVNPDGTLLEPFTDAHGRASRQIRPRPIAGGGVVFVDVELRTGRRTVQRVELRRPMATRRTLPLGDDPGAGGSPAGLPNRGSAGFEAGTAEPLPDGSLLLTGNSRPARAGIPPGPGVFLAASGESRPQLWIDADGWDEIEAIPLVRSEAPRGRPSAVDRSRPTGSVLCYDADRSDGRVGPGPAAPRAATVVVERAARSFAAVAPDGDPEGGGRPGHPGRASVNLGRASIEDDGSFFLEIPADVPLRLRTLDAAGAQIAVSGWFWVRPGETRACFGCHESREAAPVNRPVAAISRPAVRPEPGLRARAR